LLEASFTHGCVCDAGYIDHVDCLADVQDSGNDTRLDCFGIYPQVLPLAVDLVLDNRGPQYSEMMPKKTQSEIIYWGWSLHLYVFHHFHIHSRIVSTFL